MTKVAVENINTPGKTTRVDAEKYNDMRAALITVVGDTPMTAAQIKAAVVPLLSGQLFPEGKTAGWWLKCVQLDLEAKALLTRRATKPLSWSKP